MYDISIDKRKNRLLIKIIGELKKENLKNYNTDVKIAIDKLKEHFTVLADLKDADISVLEDYHSFKQIREYGQIKGIKASVVVLDKLKTDFLQNKMSVKNRNIVNSNKQAEDFLDNLK
ncbi:hypothetical protein PV797_03250 [Clostridiaceae bacterium M8S5]|nr:hypothetical protein PV797_03250 [Clostridiaceae bacterium M8S5]